MKYLLILSTIILFSSCSRRVQTNVKDMAEKPRFSRMLIIVQDSRNENAHARSLMSNCPKGYTVCTASYQSDLAFNSVSDFIKKQNMDCNADVVLVVKKVNDNLVTTSTVVTQGVAVSTPIITGRYVLELRTLPDQEPYWKGQVDASRKFPTRAIYKQMQRDGVMRESALQ